MFNVNQITAQLAKLPDQSLQRYAMMHKDDPYVVSLALAESNRRKQTRMGAQMNAPQQPKVADQAIQGMAAVDPMGNYVGTPMPETVGIGQLPAKNIAKMAGGGIVAFGDGGEVPRYNGTQGSQVVYPGMLPTQGSPLLPTTSGYEGMTAAEFVRQFGLDAYNKLRNYLGSEKANAAKMYGGRPADAYEATRDRGPDPFGYDAAQYPMPEGTPASVAPVPAADVKTVVPAVPSTQRQPASPAQQPPAQRPAVSPPATGGLYSLATTPEQIKKEMAAMGITSGVPNEITSGITALQKEEQALADRRLSEIQAEQKARGPALKGFEERLRAKEERIGKEEGTLGPMALLQAGLSIMAGTSPFGLANIGAGASVGLKSYTEGLDKLERARDKLDESFAKIEEVRRNEGRMDSKELREAKLDAMKPAIEAKKLGLSALEKNWGFDRQDATKGLELLFRNRQTIIEQEGADRRTAMEVGARKEIAGMLPGEARTAIFLGEGKTDQEKYISGAKRIQEATADKTGMAAVKLLTETNAKLRAVGDPPITMAELLASAQEYSRLMYPRTTSAVPGGAPVLKQP